MQPSTRDELIERLRGWIGGNWGEATTQGLRGSKGLLRLESRPVGNVAIHSSHPREIDRPLIQPAREGQPLIRRSRAFPAFARESAVHLPPARTKARESLDNAWRIDAVPRGPCRHCIYSEGVK